MSRPRVRIDEQHLRRGLAAGRTLTALAAELGVARQTVANRAAALSLPRCGTPDIETEVHAAFDALAPGCRTVQALCSRVGRPRPVVLRALDALGLRPDVRVPDRAAQARALREQGLTWSEVSAALGYRGPSGRSMARRAAVRAGWRPESGVDAASGDTP